MSCEVQIGDLVWAKMKGFRSWPGRVVNPKPHIKKPATKTRNHCIYFFGSHDYAYIFDSNLKPFHEYKSIFINSSKTPAFEEAVADIEKFIKKKEEDPAYEPEEEDEKNSEFDKILEEDEMDTPKKKRKNSSSGKRPSSTTSKAESTGKKRQRLQVEENGVSPASGSHQMKFYDELLNRPTLLDIPVAPMVDLKNVSDSMKKKNIEASSLAFGFLGLGIMGSGILKNLVNSGHKVNIWNRTFTKADDLKAQADISHPGQVEAYRTPSDIVRNSDIIFCCLSDTAAVKEIIYGNCGILDKLDSMDGKGYVEMTNVDSECSLDVCNEITGKGGRYLEAQMQGSKQEAHDGNLIILGAGDQTLFNDCESCFKAIGKTIFYLGEVGFASKMNIVLQLMKGVALVGIAEGLALADRSGLSLKDVLEIFSLTNLSSPFLKTKADLIISMNFKDVEQPIQHMQKDMRIALELADSLKQPLLMTSTANEVYKHARRLGHDNHDAAAVYMRARY